MIKWKSLEKVPLHNESIRSDKTDFVSMEGQSLRIFLLTIRPLTAAKTIIQTEQQP